MRYQQISEAPISDDLQLANRYYHGTATIFRARKIMRHGIQPPDFQVEDRKNTMMRPVRGKVYLTPHIGYAQIYAIGGNVAGSNHMQVPYTNANKKVFQNIWNDDKTSRHYGRFGYLFVINRDQLRDVQPDEDEVGELFHALLKPATMMQHIVYEPWARQLRQNMLNDPSFAQAFMNFCRYAMTPATLHRIQNGGEYAYYARGGKQAVAKMADDMKLRLVQYGCHVAHGGVITPSEVWKIDKAKVGYLTQDGGNFFQIAERIK